MDKQNEETGDNGYFLDSLYKEGIEKAEKKCIPFDITFGELDGKYGILFMFSNKTFIVNPIALCSSMFNDDEYYDMLTLPDDLSRHQKVVVRKTPLFWQWQFMYFCQPIMDPLNFTYKDYVDKIIHCLSELYKAEKEGKPIAEYRDGTNYDKETLRFCTEQTQLYQCLGSHETIRSGDVTIEEFHFDGLNGDDGEHFAIGIGNRVYDTYYSHWDNNEEPIRHTIENLTFGSGEVVLNFDLSPTTISFNRKRLLQKVTERGEGAFYDWKDFVFVKIIPNEYKYMPVISGFCETKRAIEELYQGYLYMALDCPLEIKDIDDDPPTLINAYNRRKSPIIENYLVLKKKSSIQKRQVIIEHILTIDPDYLDYIHDEEDVYSCAEDYLSEESVKSNREFLDRFDSWADEMKSIVIASETGEPYEKDWEDFHKRGLELASEYRKILPDNFDLWYSAPFEDKSGYIKKPILIMKHYV